MNCSAARANPMEATVAKIRKSATAEIWVRMREYQGRQYVDLREHFFSGDDRIWHPTKKGVMVLDALLPQILDGVAALEGVAVVGTVACVGRASGDEIQIGVREYQRARYGELRVWYLDGNKDRKPSHKGVTFSLGLIEQLGAALRD